ncbi:MAG: hypothetical protein IT438_12770 [Phycisphaerales bacterium]|nr:hypothetical protein [Phycisphaerales bacterium]
MLGPATTLDDRGQDVDLIRPKQLGRDQADIVAAPALGKFLAEVVKAESRRISPARVALSVAACAVLIFARLFYRRIFPGAPPLMVMILFWGGLALFIVAMRIMTRRTHGFTLASTAVSSGLCGSCGYSLHKLDAEGDGCVTCPECGAAWRACRITRPHWVTASFVPYRSPWLLRWIGMVPTDKQLLGRDARGAYFRIIDKHLRLLSPDRRAELGSDRLRLIRRAVGRVGFIGRCLVALIPAALSAVLAYAGLRTLPHGTGDNFTIVVLLFTLSVIFGLLTAITVRSHIFSLADRRGAVLAARGLCGCCASDLPADEPQPDGFTNCTTCGAAWRVPGASDGALCEACRYSLSGLFPDPNGRVTCPECGALAFMPVAHAPAPPL